MKILFVISTLQLGGIETYLSRVIPQLNSNGHEIFVNVLNKNYDAGLYQKLKDHAKVTFVSRFKRLGNLFLFGRVVRDQFDLVYVTGVTSLLYVLLNWHNKHIQAKLVVGVYFQFEFTQNLEYYRNKKISQFINNFEKENIIFCTDGCRADFSRIYGGRFQSSMVSPLYSEIGNHQIDFLKELPSEVKILSVGRLVSFKNYNLYMPHIIRRLIDAEIKVVWTVVGDGPLLDELKSEIKKHSVEPFVKLIGSISYQRLPDFYKSADLYIGAGTTLIEASSYGIPSVCTIDNHEYPVSTGYFHDRAGYTTSDILDGEKVSDVYELIYRFSKMELSGRNSLKNQARRASLKYDLSNVNADFVMLASAARPVNLDKFGFSRFKDICSIFYIRLIKKFV